MPGREDDSVPLPYGPGDEVAYGELPVRVHGIWTETVTVDAGAVSWTVTVEVKVGHAYACLCLRFWGLSS